MNRLELYINNTLVDAPDLSVKLTMAIADVKFPSRRGGTGTSITVTLPGTKTINKLLTGIYEIAYDIQTSGTVNFSPDFNPNLKASVYILHGGATVFIGYMKLLQINRDQQDLDRISYEVQLIGEIMNLFASIGEAYLTDLDLSEYNHTYNKATQEATWTDTNYGTGYVYPMINYGTVSNDASWDVNDFFPAVYAKTYVDKIFSAAGWTYSSTFFDSAFFKRLIIPFNREKLALTAAQIQSRLFSANTQSITSGSVNIDPTATSAGTSNRPFVFTNEISDAGNQYNPATGIFTCAVAGTYTFYTSGVAYAQAQTAVTLGGNQIYSVSSAIQRNGVTFSSAPYLGNTSGGGSYNAGDIIYTQTFEHTAGVVLQVGDTIEADLVQNVGVTFGSGSGTVHFAVSSGTLFKNTISITNVVDGNALDMSSAIPKDVKQADFLMAIIKMFNLYAEVDKTYENKLIIDTADNFYGAGTTVDWTTKLDVGQGVEIFPMGALEAKQYLLTYTQDSDYWNKDYTDTFNAIYGEKKVDIANDFLKNTNTTEVIFAPTPLIGSDTHDRIIPEIYTVTSAGALQQMRSKVRILYWAGAIATADTWTYTSTPSGNTNETTYPYAGHLDNPVTPTLDLCFGVPRQVYYDSATSGTITYTNNNVYNAYHSKYVTEITDKNSKIVTGYFLLRPLDIHAFSFRNKIYIDGHLYRPQKIVDFNVNGGGITKVELLKIKDGVPFTASTGLSLVDGVLVNSSYVPDSRQ